MDGDERPRRERVLYREGALSLDPTVVVAVSDRLILRRWERSDAAPLFAICRHKEVARLYGSRPRRRREVTAAIDDFNGREAGLSVTTWAVALRQTGTLVGWCGYARPNVAWLNADVVEIGWLIDFASWGQGLAPEAAAQALRIGEKHLPRSRIISKCRDGNTQSERVMQKIGLRRVGVVSEGVSSTVVYRHG